MRALGCLGIALSFLSGCILLAIVAELYYFFWWKKRVAERDSEVDAHASPVRDLLQLFNLKKPCPPEAADGGGAPEEQLRLDSKDLLLKLSEEDQDAAAAEEELMTLAAPQRSLFTITEETQEDLEAAAGGSRRVRKSRAGSKGMSLRDWLQSAETPILTPLSSPPFFSPPTAACYNLNGLNPLFEPSSEDDSGWPWPSPPPKLQFLVAAEAKLHRKTLMEEALKGGALRP